MARSMEIGEKIAKSRAMGATDTEIIDFASKNDPSFAEKYNKSIQMGAQPSDVLDFLSKSHAEKSPLETIGEVAHKGARLGLQATLGGLEGTTGGMLYDIATTGVGALKAGGRYLEKQIGIKQPEETFEFPTIGESAKYLGEKIGIDTEPKSVAERSMRLAFNLKEIGKKAVGLQAGKSIIGDEIKKVAASAPLAAAAVAGKEIWGVPEFATLVAGGFGIPVAKEIAKKTGQGLKWAANEWLLFNVENVDKKNIIDSVKKEWGNARRNARSMVESGAMSQDQFNAVKPYLDRAAQYNIPVNLGALTDSSRFKKTENIISKRNLTQESANEFRQKAAEGWANSYVAATNNISRTHMFQQQGEVADALLTDVTRKQHESLKKEASDKFTKSAKGFSDAESLGSAEIKELEDSANKVVEKVGSSLFPTTAEETTKSAIQRTKQNLRVSPTEAGRPELEHVQFPTGKSLMELEQQQAGRHITERQGYWAKERAKAFAKGAGERAAETQKESQKRFKELLGKEGDKIKFDPETGKITFSKDIKPKNLVDTVRSLNSYIEWENPEVRNLTKDFQDTARRILGRKYGKSHPEAYKDYLEANQLYSKQAKLFGEKAPWKKWGVKSDTTPEELLATIKSPSRFKQFEKDFGGSAKGKELIDEMKRIKVQEKLSPLFEEWAPGKVYKGVNRLLRDKEFNTYLTKEARENLKGLADLDGRIARTTPQVYKHREEQELAGELRDWAVILSSPITWAKKLGYTQLRDRAHKAFADVMFDANLSKQLLKTGNQAASALSSPNTSKSTFQNILADIEQLGNTIFETEAMIAAQGLRREETE